ncbi:MAG TPA: thiamine pyrophosphate-dependent enzyme [Burkholderiales bacterium]|nr:thiamine pyrophosphate-dependent enzyme [Burkholderiales bacterium]
MFNTKDALELFAKYRGDAIVVPGRGGRHWINISEGPMDVPLGDPAMGGHCGFALGLAMALPKRRVVLIDSEGDLQMSLSVLMTVAEQKPANFYHFMLDNECYGTTGGQPVPNAKNVQYDLIAKGAGYPRAYAFTELEAFGKALPEIMNGPGPVFVAMKVVPEVENEAIGVRKRWIRRTKNQAIADMRKELRIGV